MAEMLSELSRKDDVIRELQLRNQYLEGDRSFETKKLGKRPPLENHCRRQTSNVAFLLNYRPQQ